MKLTNICLLVLAAIIAESNQDGTGNKKEFLLTYEGLFPLVDTDYRWRAARYTHIRDGISLSMYRYYMAQHLYARLAGIRYGSKDAADISTAKLRSLLYTSKIRLPSAFINYLNALGDIRPEGTSGSETDLKLSFAIWPNDNGDFGKINESNHWKYMSFPAPSIVAQAIQEDYSYTIDPVVRRQPFWNVRSHLVPDDNGDATSERCKSPGLPTQNLLGWKPRTELTPQQFHILQTCGITDDGFDAFERKFYVNPCLIQHIGFILHENSPNSEFIEQEAIKLQPYYASSRATLAPLFTAYSVLNPNFKKSMITFSRTTVHTDYQMELSGWRPNDLHGVLAVALMVSKETELLTWCIYDWSEYRCIPQKWIDSANFILHFNGRFASFPAPVRGDYGREDYRLRFLGFRN